MSSTLRTAALVLLAVLAGCAARQDADRDTTVAFDDMDRNDDDVVEQQEFAAAFDRFDLDDDGLIEASESAAIVYEADENRDGGVTPEEFRSIDLTRLAADANLDGRLSRREIERYTRERPEQLGPRSARRGTVAELDRDNRWLQFRF